MSIEYKVTDKQIEGLLDFCGDKEVTTKVIINHLFPSYKRKDEPFCKIGQILKRDQYPNSFYTVMKMQAFTKEYIVRLVNITNCEIWAEYLEINNLKRYDQHNEITYGEFQKLSNSNGDFSIYKP